MDVEKQRMTGAAVECELAEQTAELTGQVLRERGREHVHRAFELGRARAGERLVREDLLRAQIDQRLKHAVTVALVDDAPNRFPERRLGWSSHWLQPS